MWIYHLISLSLSQCLLFYNCLWPCSEKQKSLSVSGIILPPRVIVGQKGRVSLSIEGRRVDQVQTAWFLNDTPIFDNSLAGRMRRILLFFLCSSCYTYCLNEGINLHIFKAQQNQSLKQFLVMEAGCLGNWGNEMQVLVLHMLDFSRKHPLTSSVSPSLTRWSNNWPPNTHRDFQS